MTKNEIGFGFGKTGDERSARSLDAGAKAGNAEVAFARWYREEFLSQPGSSLVTVSEARKVFAIYQANGWA